ncbi:MAG: hypothetical protein ACR2KK_20785 [Acidimicrobiales bacterium]
MPAGRSIVGALFDADLAILGAMAVEYDRCALAIREEHAHVPDESYLARRLALLEQFLSLPRPLRTGEMNARLDASTRVNLRREIDRLSVGGVEQRVAGTSRPDGYSS